MLLEQFRQDQSDGFKNSQTVRIRQVRSNGPPEQKLGKYKKSSSQLAEAIYGDFSQASVYNYSQLNSDRGRPINLMNQNQQTILFNQTERLKDLKQ